MPGMADMSRLFAHAMVPAHAKAASATSTTPDAGIRASPRKRTYRLRHVSHQADQANLLANPLRPSPLQSMPKALLLTRSTGARPRVGPAGCTTMLVERHRVTVGGEHPLAGVVDRLARLDVVPATVVGDGDRQLLDAEELAQERRNRRRRSTQLAPEHPSECAHLLLAGPIVDEDPELPVPLGHQPRGLGDQHKGATGHVRALDVASLHLKGEREPAVVVGRRAGHVRPRARADRIARAVLEELTLHRPAHQASPRR